jgi:hypothetical protein
MAVTCKGMQYTIYITYLCSNASLFHITRSPCALKLVFVYHKKAFLEQMVHKKRCARVALACHATKHAHSTIAQHVYTYRANKLVKFENLQVCFC